MHPSKSNWGRITSNERQNRPNFVPDQKYGSLRASSTYLLVIGNLESHETLGVAVFDEVTSLENSIRCEKTETNWKSVKLTFRAKDCTSSRKRLRINEIVVKWMRIRPKDAHTRSLRDTIVRFWDQPETCDWLAQRTLPRTQ